MTEGQLFSCESWNFQNDNNTWLKSIYRFINALDKLSLSLSMLRELVTNLYIMPQFSEFLLWKTINENHRDSTPTGFASSTGNGGDEICFSLFHCCIKQWKPDEKLTASVGRAIFYTREQEQGLRWIVIGRPVLWDLQRVYLNETRSRVLNLYPAFITFIATKGWQIMMDLIEDDLATVCIP